MLRTFFLCVFVSLSAIAVSADPLTITQGSITARMGFGTFSFDVSAPNFSLRAGSGFLVSSIIPCLGCGPGQTITMNSNTNTMFFTEWDGIVTTGGSTYTIGLPGVQGLFIFSTPSFVLPSTNDSTLTLNAPFTMGANLSNPGIFSFQLSGSGLATMILNNNGSFYTLQSVTYNFVAVPEPASILLVCFGVLGLAVRLRRAKA